MPITQAMNVATESHDAHNTGVEPSEVDGGTESGRAIAVSTRVTIIRSCTFER